MTLFAEGPDLLVDLSNVCRDEKLLGPRERASWKAFERVIVGLKNCPIALNRVYLIADRSLYPLLDNDGRANLKRFREKGLLEETPLADERLIGFAFDEDSPFNDAVIMSRDFFDDFRRDYPQIQGSKDRFLDWRVEPDGRVTIHWRDMQQRTHMRISRKIEVGEMKARRLLRETIRERALARDFRCSGKDCILAQLWPDRLREFPVYDRQIDGFVCPSCSRELESLGRREPAKQIVVYLDGEEQLRVLLNDELMIGRTDSKSCIGLDRAISPDQITGISSRHLRLELRGDRVLITDLESKNGTRIEPRRGGATKDLATNTPVEFRSSDRVLLPGWVWLEHSGQAAPFEGERPINETIVGDQHIFETMIDLG